MRVKSLDLQKPVIIHMIGLQKFQTGRKGLWLRHLFFSGHMGAVDSVLNLEPGRSKGIFRLWLRFNQMFRLNCRVQICFPGVTLLSTETFP